MKLRKNYRWCAPESACVHLYLEEVHQSKMIRFYTIYTKLTFKKKKKTDHHIWSEGVAIYTPHAQAHQFWQFEMKLQIALIDLDGFSTQQESSTYIQATDPISQQTILSSICDHVHLRHISNGMVHGISAFCFFFSSRTKESEYDLCVCISAIVQKWPTLRPVCEIPAFN